MTVWTPDGAMLTRMERHRAPLEAGLRWLYDTPQPDDAVLQHHGATLPGGTPGRRFRFVPIGSRSPVIVIDAPVQTGLWPGEPEALGLWLEYEGFAVADTWNGSGATGSVRLSDSPHPSLRAAVDRYRAGCPIHHTVFCDREGCTWYRDGYRKVRQPELAALAGGAVTRAQWSATVCSACLRASQ